MISKICANKLKLCRAASIFPIFLVLLMVSPCFALDSDYLGIPRPQGAGIDLGACEFVPGQMSYPLSIKDPVQNFDANNTNYQAFAVSGYGESGEILDVYVGSTIIGTTTVTDEHTWAIDVDFSTISEGAVEITAKANSEASAPVKGLLTKTYDVNAPRNLRVAD